MQRKDTAFPAKRRDMRPERVLAVGFLALILLGTLLLALPAASASGQSIGAFNALFTATSAVCVTGLVVVDTASSFTSFGHGVLLALIQSGGLGFMVLATMVMIAMGRKITLRDRLLIRESMNASSMAGVVRLSRVYFVMAAAIELTGAALLAIRFVPAYGWSRGIWYAVFHAVSAFCNAGFDLFGTSLTAFRSDGFVLGVISLLIILGGIGFAVLFELGHIRRGMHALSLHARIVLLLTAVLLVSGTAFYALLEWNNPETLGHMGIGDKLLNSFFQSVTSRTAGFASISQAGLSEAGKAVTVVLMLIGGSSGSTAGGIKTVTLMVLMLFLWSRIRGKGSVSVFKRTIPDNQVMDAMTICGIVLLLALFGGIVISATCGLGFTDSLYEAVSALATVGLTADVTGKLNLFSKILIIIYMYFGRVGVLTISLGFLMGDKAQERYRYAQTNLLIG